MLIAPGRKATAAEIAIVETLRSAVRELLTSVSSVSAKPKMMPERYWASFAAKGEALGIQRAKLAQLIAAMAEDVG